MLVANFKMNSRLDNIQNYFSGIHEMHENVYKKKKTMVSV